MIWQLLFNGLITGILYSLIAIGFALVYYTTRIFHLAAAGIYVFAAYTFWLFATIVHWPIIAAAIAAIMLSMLLSLLLELLVYHPLKNKNASPNVTMVTSIGLMTIIINTIILFFGNESKTIIHGARKLSLTYGDITIHIPQLYQAVIGTGALVAFFIILHFSSFGLRLRALSDDETLFKTLGYSTPATRVVVFLLSGAFIALASCLKSFEISIDPQMAMALLLNAIVAMIIGGVGKFSTCILGGLAIGLLESLTVTFFPAIWVSAVTFTVLIMFLFLRPQGIAGYKQRTV